MTVFSSRSPCNKTTDLDLFPDPRPSSATSPPASRISAPASPSWVPKLNLNALLHGVDENQKGETEVQIQGVNENKERETGVQVQGVVSGGRHLYKKDGVDIWIEYVPSTATWQVKPGRDRGKDTCWMHSIGQAREAGVEEVKGGWAVGGEDFFHVQAGVTVARHAAAVLVSGATGPHSENINGLYRPMEGEASMGRPEYKKVEVQREHDEAAATLARKLMEKQMALHDAQVSSMGDAAHGTHVYVCNV